MTYAQWVIEAFCCTYYGELIDRCYKLELPRNLVFQRTPAAGVASSEKPRFPHFQSSSNFSESFFPFPLTHFPELLERKVEKFKKRPSSFVSIHATRVRRRAKTELLSPNSTPRSSSSSIWHHICAFPIYFEVKITFLKNDSNSCGGCFYRL